MNGSLFVHRRRSLRKLTRFRHAPFHTCYLYPVHLWPGSSVNWGPTFRKHRKYDINTLRLCPRDARDLSLAHFPASIYPGKTSPSRLQEGLPPAPSPPPPSPPPTMPPNALHLSQKKEITPERSSAAVSCAIESGSANTHHGGYGARLLLSNQISLWWDINAQTDLKSWLLSRSKLKKGWKWR